MSLSSTSLKAIQHLPLDQQVAFIVAAESFPTAVRNFKVRYLTAALQAERGHVRRAARRAGIHPLQFVRFLKELEIPVTKVCSTNRNIHSSSPAI
jgi:DNA-binding NtrC family response regulator